MPATHSLDELVRQRLRTWPQRPPGLSGRGFGREAWMRGRPATKVESAQPPFLKLPGSDRLRTLPDGLWLNFGGKAPDGYVDILAIEACSTLTNLLDKRSRFAPSVQSLLAVCPVAWLLAPVNAEDDTPRWRLTGLLKQEPKEPLILPVRDIRVLYGLKPRHYLGFATTQVPHPHEFFVPVEAITAENGHEDPALQALLERASARANFLTMPNPTRRELAGRMPPIPFAPHPADP
jgi:hypothetical protein